MSQKSSVMQLPQFVPKALTSDKEKIRIVVSGLRGEESIAALCRREGIVEKRKKIKKLTTQNRRLNHQYQAA